MSLKSSSVKKAGKVAKEAEDLKMTKYSHLTAHYQFVAVAIETLFFGPSAQSLRSWLAASMTFHGILLLILICVNMLVFVFIIYINAWLFAYLTISFFLFYFVVFVVLLFPCSSCY